MSYAIYPHDVPLHSCVIIDSVGSALDFYRSLWNKGHSDDEVEPLHTDDGVTVFVPHTVIYTNHAISSWFFSSLVDGQYKKKKHRNISNEEILRIFKQQSRRHNFDCVAVWTWAYSPAADSIAVTEYFSMEQLTDFLWTREEKYYGSLQAFVPPHGEFNKSVRVTWTPHVSMCEARRTVFAMGEKIDKRSKEDRYTTFGACENKLSALQTQASTTVLGHCVRGFASKIVRRATSIMAISKGVADSSLVCNFALLEFRAGFDGRLYFLRCSGLNVTEQVEGSDMESSSKWKAPEDSRRRSAMPATSDSVVAREMLRLRAESETSLVLEQLRKLKMECSHCVAKHYPVDMRPRHKAYDDYSDDNYRSPRDIAESGMEEDMKSLLSSDKSRTEYKFASLTGLLSTSNTSMVRKLKSLLKAIPDFGYMPGSALGHILLKLNPLFSSNDMMSVLQLLDADDEGRLECTIVKEWLHSLIPARPDSSLVSAAAVPKAPSLPLPFAMRRLTFLGASGSKPDHKPLAPLSKKMRFHRRLARLDKGVIGEEAMQVVSQSHCSQAISPRSFEAPPSLTKMSATQSFHRAYHLAKDTKDKTCRAPTRPDHPIKGHGQAGVASRFERERGAYGVLRLHENDGEPAWPDTSRSSYTPVTTPSEIERPPLPSTPPPAYARGHGLTG